MSAGIVGMACAILTLEGQAVPSLPHLRTVNPHVVSSLDAAKGTGGTVGFPRQAAALTNATSDGRVTSGVSSFAFQASCQTQAAASKSCCWLGCNGA